jgi:hypothetical protein
MRFVKEENETEQTIFELSHSNAFFAKDGLDVFKVNMASSNTTIQMFE